jgi:hypothetical protein
MTQYKKLCQTVFLSIYIHFCTVTFKRTVTLRSSKIIALRHCYCLPTTLLCPCNTIYVLLCYYNLPRFANKSTYQVCKAYVSFKPVRKGKCKAIQLQPLTGPEGSRRLRLPDQITRQSAHEGGKAVSSTHWPPLPQEIFLVLISV